MLELSELPVLYYVTLAVIVALIAEAGLDIRRSWTRPAIALYLTITVWYLGDMLYNGPLDFYGQFSTETINFAFFQVIIFLLSYRMFLLLGTGLFLTDKRPALIAGSPGQENVILFLIGGAWAFMTAIGLAMVEFDVWSILFPPLSREANYPWGRSAVGSGLDFMVSFLEYTHMAMCGLLGVLAVIVRPKLRPIAVALFLVSIQMYLFQRARNRMLGVLLPGILAYLLVSPVPVWKKFVVGTACFLAISTWFLIVVGSRDKEGDMVERMQAATQFDPSNTSKHYGLNMFEELCWHGILMSSGAYAPSPGERYFNELAILVPRAIWPNKPLLGIDYAIARGFGGANTDIGVFATISSGMIGQGVQNFGPWVGPPAAALLMAVWNWILARLWIRRADYLHLGLFLLGMGLTYNLGRDVTLLVLFPFLFSFLGVKVYELASGKSAQAA